MDLSIDYSKANLIVIQGAQGSGKSQLSAHMADAFDAAGRPAHIYDGGIPETPGSETPCIIVIDSVLFAWVGDELCEDADVIVNADIVQFDRGLGHYRE